MPIHAVLAALSPATMAGCATPPRTAPMSFEQCSAALICTVQGRLSAKMTEGVWVGEMTLSSGHCVRVSLPEREVARLRSQGPAQRTISGQVFGDPPRDVEVAFLTVSGRRVGLGTCGDFFIFERD